MATFPSDQLLQMETTCGTLLYELQMIWDEVGEPDAERDKMILELEQECLEVYRRKVDQANRSRAQLRQAIADAEAELAAICSAMCERPVHLRQSNLNATSLKEELNNITTPLEEMRKRKSERLSQLLEVTEQIRKISSEIRPNEQSLLKMAMDDSDLSYRKLEEYHRVLGALQKEKADRLNQVMELLSTLNSLCGVLGIDFKQTAREVHPSLDEAEGSKSTSDSTIERLASVIERLRETKKQRLHKLQDLAASMLELWNLMDTPSEEQQIFQNITCKIAASEHEITEPNTLSVDCLNSVEAEVLRLEEIKASKMKDLVLKKKAELEELLRKAHLVAGNTELGVAIEAIEAGAIDPSLVLAQIEAQISCTKEEAFSRREILERVEKWVAACEEEAWLEEYNRDDNRYSAGRGAHLTLKRAEKARLVVQRIPGIVEALSNKIIAWEKERGIEFSYDGVRLLSMLEEYTIVCQEKELERKRQRDQKKLQSQLIAEQEALFGSKPSPSKPQGAKKMPRTSTGGPSRRFSLGAVALQPTKKTDVLYSARATHSTKKGDGLSHISPAKRRGDAAVLPVKKLSFNSANSNALLQFETPRKNFSFAGTIAETREPFAPLAPTNNIPLTTLHLISKAAAVEENKSPMAITKMHLIPTPNTPATMSAPMQMANTPASDIYQAPETPALIPRTLEETEYSFEERRLAFYLTR
ncbi:65-kDa microtubule-associated protein 3 [Apostasia shenzhenica]|uniref:65-kDa microtubule-associated protein 3 n=1 Tax=Apostasia shenzhenica TaxID=1088818 RepID=A0A2I0B3M9_9ASPA|nr:65-kDa microtubule-associated protein 3 [Apostasia shenzhenica]